MGRLMMILTYCICDFFHCSCCSRCIAYLGRRTSDLIAEKAISDAKTLIEMIESLKLGCLGVLWWDCGC